MDWGTNVLAAENVAVFRGERLVFRDLSLSVPPGGALVLSGPNGSGKSTLLRLLAGLIRPAAGRLLWDGADALADLAGHGRRVAYLGHQDAVKPGLTVTENLRFAAAVSRRPISAALEAVGLEMLADLPARMLSAGQKRRLALSRLLLSSAPLWLLDEPTLGLDAASIERFGRLLAGHRAAAGIVVAATHVCLPMPDSAQLRLEPYQPDAIAKQPPPDESAHASKPGAVPQGGGL
jgi:heme exporter protein A